MAWEEIIEEITPHVVKIETPGGYGSGFLAFYNHDKSWCGIATAAHVIDTAFEWLQPIKIRNAASPNPLLLTPENRYIFIDKLADSAVVFFQKNDLQLPETPITLTPTETPCAVGSDVGWLGFPNIEPYQLCFFSGTVSAYQPHRKSYLIDGVAINGVSGGPVFHRRSTGEVQIIGSVSAYHANRATGEALPGLLRAQDVSQFRGAAETIKSLDEANLQKQTFESDQQTDANTLLIPSPHDALKAEL